MNIADVKALMADHGYNPKPEQVEILAAWSTGVEKIVTAAQLDQGVELTPLECRAITMGLSQFLSEKL